LANNKRGTRLGLRWASPQATLGALSRAAKTKTNSACFSPDGRRIRARGETLRATPGVRRHENRNMAVGRTLTARQMYQSRPREVYHTLPGALCQTLSASISATRSHHRRRGESVRRDNERWNPPQRWNVSTRDAVEGARMGEEATGLHPQPQGKFLGYGWLALASRARRAL